MNAAGAPFVEDALEREWGENWRSQLKVRRWAKRAPLILKDDGSINWDSRELLTVMTDNWTDVFYKFFTKPEWTNAEGLARVVLSEIAALTEMKA